MRTVSHNAADIKNLTDPISQNKADVVSGSRFLNKKKMSISLSRNTIAGGSLF